MSLLKTENLSVTVDGLTVLEDISFEIEEKGVYAVLGKAELERTTLARALAGLVDSDSGNIAYKDVVLDNTKKGRAIKSKIGYLPKKSFLYPDMTAYEILDFTGRMRKVSPDKRVRQIKEALELVMLSSKSEVFVKSLTVAEQKRLLLANALIGNPSTIILDEPTENLAPDDVALFKETVAMLGKKKTVLLFTDRLSLANELADYVGIIFKGKISFWSSLLSVREKLDGDPNALLKIYAAFTDDGKGGKD